MMATINVASLNCYGLSSSVGYVAEILKNVNLIALQETWVYPWDLDWSSRLGTHINSYSISSVDVERQLLVGRPHGGLTFAWHQTLSPMVQVHPYKDTKRILGLTVKLENYSVLFLNVYFPDRNIHNDDNEFMNTLGLLSSIIAESTEDSVCVLGDFNCVPGSVRFSDVEETLNDYNVTFQDTRRLSQDTYTHVNHAHLTHSWVDHIAMSGPMDRCITSCYTLPDVGCTDHCVIGVKLDLQLLPAVHVVEDRPVRQVNWDFDNRPSVENFYRMLDNELDRLPPRMLRVGEASAARDVDVLHRSISECILKAGRNVFGYKATSQFNVPGWNDRAKQLNADVRSLVLQWNIEGRPRGGQLVFNMKAAKARFRREMRFLRQNEEQLRSQALLRNLQSGHSQDFWKGIRAMKPKSNTLPLTVDGVTGEENIANLWAQHFESIANSVITDDNRQSVNDALQQADAARHGITVVELRNAVKGIKNNKAVGNDGIPAEVYKYASNKLLVVLSILLSACLIRGELPQNLMHVVIIPLLKCKSKDPSAVDNYRPIAIATALSKVLEQILLRRLEGYLGTADSQFGFKSSHGTEMAIFSLKQTVAYYRERDSPVYLCFLDARKAFDRVNHWTLLRELLDRGTPVYLVRLFLFWFREQEFLVKWGNSMSRPFRCNNGIRQGGQLSPLFYNVYIDELNRHLRRLNTGCFIANVCVNSLCYADDMVLLAPTVTSLQNLVNICSRFAETHDIQYNTTKSVCMIVKPPRSQWQYSTQVVLDGVSLQYVDEFSYLGHIISSDGRDDKDILKQFRRQNAVGNMLIRRFGFAHIDIKIQLFKSFCYPIYCNSLWSSFYGYSLQKLTVSYSDTFKRLVRRPRYTSSSAVFAEHCSDHIKVVCRKAAYSLHCRLQASTNEIISAILDSEAFVNSKLEQRWQGMLNTTG